MRKAGFWSAMGMLLVGGVVLLPATSAYARDVITHYPDDYCCRYGATCDDPQLEQCAPPTALEEVAGSLGRLTGYVVVFGFGLYMLYLLLGLGISLLEGFMSFTSDVAERFKRAARAWKGP